MPAVTPSELARLRADFSRDWFVDECLIQRLAEVDDGAGGKYESWSTVERVMCRRTAPTAGQVLNSLTASRPETRVDWTIALPAGTDVRVTDRLVISGVTYEVEIALDRTTEIARYVMAFELA